MPQLTTTLVSRRRVPSGGVAQLERLVWELHGDLAGALVAAEELVQLERVVIGPPRSRVGDGQLGSPTAR